MEVSPHINFEESFPADGSHPGGFALESNAQTIYLNDSRNHIGFGVKNGLFKLLNFIEMRGDFLLDLSTGDKVTVNTSLPVDLSSNSGLSSIRGDLEDLKSKGYLSENNQTLVDLPVSTVSISASDVDIFIGFGPYFNDSNQDGVIDSSDTPNSDAIGLKLLDISAGLVIMNPTDAVDPNQIIPNFVAAKAIWLDPIELDLGPLFLDIDDLVMNVNQGGQWKEIGRAHV